MDQNTNQGLSFDEPTKLKIAGYAYRVRHGAILLDIRFPKWYNEIDLAILDMGISHECVLGQLAELRGTTYYSLAEDLDLKTMKKQSMFGFWEDWDLVGESDYRLLTAAWTHEIKLRRRAETCICKDDQTTRPGD